MDHYVGTKLHHNKSHTYATVLYITYTEKGDRNFQLCILENYSFFANVFLNIRPIKQDKEAFEHSVFSCPVSKSQAFFSSCL